MAATNPAPNGASSGGQRLGSLPSPPPPPSWAPRVPPPLPPSIPPVLSRGRWKSLSLRTWGLAAGGVATAALLGVLLLRHGGNKTPDLAAEGGVAADMKSAIVPAEAETRPTAAPKPTPPLLAGAAKALDLPDLIEKVGPSVVQLNVSGPTGSFTGSGFAIDKQGTIVTNYHVIEDATEGTVVFSDKTSTPISGYVGAWPEKDIALLHVECPPEKLHALAVATASPRQGERVAAFGSPLGFSQSVSDGIVSALRQSKEFQSLAPLEIDALLIQTTAPISPGNSGGPLVNMQGMVVGVNTLGSVRAQNLNFAVSAADVQPVLWGPRAAPMPLPVGGTAQSTAGKVRRLLDRACAHVAAAEFDQAIADCTEAIRLDPKYTPAYVHRGSAYESKGDYDMAIADFTEAIRLDPRNAEAFTLRDLAYRERRDKLEPLLRRAVEHLAAEEFDEAVADYTEAIRLDPKNGYFYSLRGRMYYKIGQQYRANQDFAKAKALGCKQWWDDIPGTPPPPSANVGDLPVWTPRSGIPAPPDQGPSPYQQAYQDASWRQQAQAARQQVRQAAINPLGFGAYQSRPPAYDTRLANVIQQLEHEAAARMKMLNQPGETLTPEGEQLRRDCMHYRQVIREMQSQGYRPQQIAQYMTEALGKFDARWSNQHVREEPTPQVPTAPLPPPSGPWRK